MNVVRHIVDDTKDKDAQWQAEMIGENPVIAVENPEEVMAKIQQQANYLGPIMEEILRATQERGQSHWGLNE